MHSRWGLGLGLVLALTATPAFADYEIQFIRTTCVPEAGYFQLEYRDVPSMMTTVSGVDSAATRRKLATAWAARGFHSPQNMAVDCSLPGHVFHIVATQDAGGSGFCMAYPPIGLRVTRDGKAWLEAAIGGQECDSGSTVSINSVEVGPDAVRLCVSANSDGASQCRFIWNEQQKLFPLDQTDIEAIVTSTGTSNKSESAWIDAITAGRNARKTSSGQRQ